MSSVVTRKNIPGEEIWMLGDVIHRPEDQGPAIMLYTFYWYNNGIGDTTYYIFRVVQYVHEGVLHRENGPAVIVDYHLCSSDRILPCDSHQLDYTPFLRLDIVHGVLRDYDLFRNYRPKYSMEVLMYNNDVTFFNRSSHCCYWDSDSLTFINGKYWRSYLLLPKQIAMPPHGLKKLCIIEYKKLGLQAELPKHLEDEIVDWS